MEKYLPKWYLKVYNTITNYEQEIAVPVERIKAEMHVKTLFGVYLVVSIGIISSEILTMSTITLSTHIGLIILQIYCGIGFLRLYHKKPQHLGTILSIIILIANFFGTNYDETLLFSGLTFAIVLPNFISFLTQSKQMALIGFLYSVTVNMVAGPKFYDLIMRESGNQSLANLLDAGRITFNVFTFYNFAFTAFGDSRSNKILNTLALTLKAEEQMKKEKELLNAKSLFFSCFSHEMRNPLNCILNSMDYTIKYSTDNVIHDILSTGKACGSMLLNLINNILDMGKIDSNNICLNEDIRDSKQFITNTWRVTQELFKKKKQIGEIFIDRDFPMTILIDDTRLTQVIVNLVSNACKFTDEGKTIRVIFSFDLDDALPHSERASSLMLIPTYPKLDKAESRTSRKPAHGHQSKDSIDENIDRDHFDKFASVKQTRTLLQVKHQSDAVANRYMLLFATYRADSQPFDWIPRNKDSERKGGVIKIEIIDSGCGMTEEEVGKLFQPFIQANKTITGTYGGTGLGLYITQSLTKLMKGTITVKSEVNMGSTFTVSIPNDPIHTSETNSTNKLMKSQSPFARFKIILCSNKPDTNTSWIPRNVQLWEFTERMRNLNYRVEHFDHFVLPQTNTSSPTVLKTYFIYDASYLTVQNINDLKNADLRNLENSVFVFQSNIENIDLQQITDIPPPIPLVTDYEALANAIHNHTKELLTTIKSKHSILVVDDDDFNRKIFSVFLTKEGYNIYTAQNGQEGFEVYCKHADKIKLVVVDYEMPICDGPTCAEKILKYIKDQNKTPVTIYGLTGNVSQESKARLTEAGIKKAWNKPAKLEEIMDEIFYVIVK